jgi:adenine/guanine phosphoribosyltransferase-like PRPP-binding protein
MAANKHVVPRPNGEWAVRSSGAAKATRVFGTQADAIKFGRSAARKDGVEFYVHRKDGTIRERDSYGRDPVASKG